jgi:hypothetical protein
MKTLKDQINEAVCDLSHPPAVGDLAWVEKRAKRIQAERPGTSSKDALLQASREGKELRDRSAKIDADVRRDLLSKSDVELDRRAKALMATTAGLTYSEALCQASREVA